MNPWIALILGFGLGWSLEYFIDCIWWENRRVCGKNEQKFKALSAELEADQASRNERSALAAEQEKELLDRSQQYETLLSESETQRMKYESLLSSADEENTILQGEVEKLSQQLQGGGSDTSNYRKEFESLQINSEATIKNLEADIVESGEKFEQELAALVIQKDELVKKVSAADKKNEALQTELAELEKKIKEEDRGIQKHKDELESLKSSSDAEIRNLQADLAVAGENYEAALEKFQNQQEELEKKIFTLQTELDLFANNPEVQPLRSEFDSATKKLDQEKNAFEFLLKENKHLADELATRKEKGKSGREQDAKSLQADITVVAEKFEQELAVLLDQKEVLEQKVSQADKKNEALKGDLAELEQQLKEEDGGIKKHKEELASLKSSSDAEIRDLQADLAVAGDNYETALEKFQNQQEELEKKIFTLQTELDLFADNLEVQPLRSEFNSANKKLGQEQSAVEILLEENKHLADELAAQGNKRDSESKQDDVSGKGDSEDVNDMRPGSKPGALETSGQQQPDDLKTIKGIGPKIEKTLNELGVYSFQQIADFTDENKDWVNSYLRFSGRIEREDWVKQAKALVAGQ